MIAPDIAAQLEKTKLAPESAVLSKKKPSGMAGEHTGVVLTNLAKIELARDKVYYKYDVTVTVRIKRNDNSLLEKDITKPSSRDTHSQQRKNACVWVYQEAIRTNGRFFDGPTAYDRAKIFFSMKKLKEASFNVQPVVDEDHDFFPGAELYKMTIKSCVETFQVTSNELENVVKDRPSQAHKMLLEVLNLFCSQTPLMGVDTFCSYGNTHYLLNDNGIDWGLPILPDSKYMAVGANKKVSVLEGENKKATAYVATELKKTNFHCDEQKLFDKIASYNHGGLSIEAMNRNRNFLVNMFRNLDVYPLYSPHQVFPIVGFHGGNAQNTFIEIGNRRLSVSEYYRERRNINLSHPTLFLVMARSRGQIVYYPVEVLHVAKNQRVVQGQTTSDEMQISIRASATVPSTRLKQTKSMKETLELVPENPNLHDAGIVVDRELAKAPARKLPAPAIGYGANRTVNSRDNAKWDPSRQVYISPADVGKWGIFGLLTGRDRNLNLNRFADAISRQMTSCGMGVQRPSAVRVIQPTVADIEAVFTQCCQEKYKFMMFISSDNTSLHADIKRLESQYQIVTQDTKGSNAYKVCLPNGATQTIQNIVNKANIKLGGVNYSVTVNPSMVKNSWLKEKARMIFGFEMSHPAPLTKSEEAMGMKYRTPSVLGFACNSAKDHQAYLGDFRYVRPRCTDPMGEEIADILPAAIKAARIARGVAPTDLVLYFHGVSEGQYSEIATTYNAFIRKGLDRLSPQYRPSITLIAVSKEHNERFFREEKNLNPKDKAAQQNIPPGTIVDSVVVHPRVNEFYLMAHSAFQGTAKALKYTVVQDHGTSMDVIETGTHALCFLHGIVAASVSMPAPLVVADRCAKRGAMVYASHTGNTSVDVGELNYEQLNEQLSNKGKILEKVRYNA